MMEEELIKIWQSSPNQEKIKFEKSRLILDMHASMDKLHRNIRFRDLREQIGIAVVIPAFAYSAYAIPFLLTKIASVLIIFWAIYVGLKLRNAKKHKPGAFYENYLDYLRHTRQYLQIQKQMLDNVLYWYILPGMTLTMLFVLGFPGDPGRSKVVWRMGIVNLVLAAVTYLLNKRAVRKEFAQRLNRVDNLIQLMEQP